MAVPQARHLKLFPSSGDSPTDFSLMRRIQSGDTSALNEVLARYWEPLVLYATRMLGASDAAEDAVQEVFLAFWDRRNHWRPSDSLRSFLLRMTRNRVLNQRRHDQVRLRWLNRNRDVESTYDNPTPLQQLEAGELERAVDSAIETLPPRRREIFVLARYSQLSYREIAEVMSISPQTVANQMSSALKELSVALEVFLDDTADG